MGEIHNLNGDARRERKLSSEEKQRMAEGRSHSRVVERYLREIATGKYHKRGPRKNDPEAIKAELSELNAKIASSPPGVEKLVLVENRRKLEQILAGRAENEAFDELENKFLGIAKVFSVTRGISYESWREMGVPARVLIKAGIYPPNKGRPSADADEEE
jgi:hypothetical protein